MPHTKKPKAPRDYPGRLTRDEYYALPAARRWLYAMRTKSDLLELWRSCRKKRCRRARACHGDELCYQRPIAADLKSPNLGQPDFEFSYKYPKELDEPFVDLENLPYNSLIKPPPLRRRK
jgi:hypothetical protein